jgi:hypothetical protein
MTDKDKPLADSDDFNINTAPEIDALNRAVADGKYGRHYIRVGERKSTEGATLHG